MVADNDYVKGIEVENEKLRQRLVEVEEELDALKKPKVFIVEKDVTSIAGDYLISSNYTANKSGPVSNPAPAGFSDSMGYNTLRVGGISLTEERLKFLLDSCNDYQKFKKAGIWEKIKIIFFTKEI